MQFNSISFLFCFLPVFLAVYYLVPGKWRNIPLLLGSLIFYVITIGQHWWMLLPMAGVMALAYCVAVYMDKIRYSGLFAVAMGYLLLVLAFFKVYSGGVFLPVGISFYLFQISAYLFSVYRRTIPAEKNILNFMTQVLMFPKLLSGPIMDARQLQEQTKLRTYSSEQFHEGLQELIAGLALKVLLANRIGGLWAQAGVVGYDAVSPGFAWVALLGYAIRLYYDFFGYSLMAVGIGKMLGFRLPDNFDDPYASHSVSEFYRRWHMTLGAWFREYVYIPMGGNRKGTGRTVLNLLFVWLLTGLWHGIGGNYLLWAGIIVLAVILERLWLGKWLKKSKVLCHFYTVLIILLSWVPFAIGDWSDMWAFFGRLFGLGGEVINPWDFVGQCKRYVWMLLAGVVLATPWPKMLLRKIRSHWAVDIALFALFWVCVYYVATSSQDPFMYFQY